MFSVHQFNSDYTEHCQMLLIFYATASFEAEQSCGKTLKDITVISEKWM